MGWLSVSHGFTAEVMARQGFDGLVVDMQHGLTDMNDVWPMLQAISQTDTVPVVRVPWNDPATIMKVLDFRDGEYVDRELIMLRVNVDAQTRSEVMQICDIFRAKIVDVQSKNVAIEITGNESKSVDFSFKAKAF